MDIIKERVLKGAVAGALATAAMSGVIAAGYAFGALRTPPPKEITGRAARKAEVRDRLPEPTFHLSWLLAHLGYGTVLGAVYSLLRRRLPSSPSVAGLTHGVAVWAGSYLGLMPALDLYPPPKHDRPSRMAVMIAAHVVYGLALAAAERRLLEKRPQTVMDRVRAFTERLGQIPQPRAA